MHKYTGLNCILQKQLRQVFIKWVVKPGQGFSKLINECMPITFTLCSSGVELDFYYYRWNVWNDLLSINKWLPRCSTYSVAIHVESWEFEFRIRKNGPNTLKQQQNISLPDIWQRIWMKSVLGDGSANKTYSHITVGLVW